MRKWIQNLNAFVQDDAQFDFETRSIDEFKVIDKQGDIKIEKDSQYETLKKLGQIFAGF